MLPRCPQAQPFPIWSRTAVRTVAIPSPCRPGQQQPADRHRPTSRPGRQARSRACGSSSACRRSGVPPRRGRAGPAPADRPRPPRDSGCAMPPGPRLAPRPRLGGKVVGRAAGGRRIAGGTRGIGHAAECGPAPCALRHAKHPAPIAPAGICGWRRHARTPCASVICQCHEGPLAVGDKGALNDFDGRQPAGNGSGRGFRTGLTEAVAAVARL